MNTEYTNRKSRNRQHTSATFRAVIDDKNLEDAIYENRKRVKALKGEGGKKRLSSYIRTVTTDTLRHQFMSGQYRPSPNQIVRIPKPQGGDRTIGIPNVKDRPIQQAVRQIIEPLCEEHISSHAYAYRKDRSTATLLQDIDKARKAHPDHKYLVKIDLHDFFGSIEQGQLLNQFQNIVHPDPALMAVVHSIVKESAVREDGKVEPVSKGVVQGGVLSPLLSNIYAAQVDDEIVKITDLYWRYSDDMVLLVRNRIEGEKLVKKITKILTKCDLQLNSKKTIIQKIDGTNFLGITFTKTGMRIPSWKLEVLAKELSERLEAQEDVTGWLKSWLNYFRNINPDIVRDWKIWKELDRYLGKYNLKFRHKGTELIKKIDPSIHNHTLACDGAGVSGTTQGTTSSL